LSYKIKITKFNTLMWFDNAFFGILLVLISYAFSFFVAGDNVHNPAFTSRESRISVAAIFGHAILCFQAFILLLSTVIFFIKNTKLNVGLASALTLFIFLVPFTSYAYIVQKEYAEVWSYRKNLLKEIITLTPDAKENTAILLITKGHEYLNPPKAIGQQPHDWGFMIDNMFDWNNSLINNEKNILIGKPFIVIVHCKDWRDKVYTKNGNTHLNCIGYPDFPVDLTNLIELDWEGTKIYRRQNAKWDIKNKDIGPTFWDNSIPSSNMLKLMPDMVNWFVTNPFKR